MDDADAQGSRASAFSVKCRRDLADIRLGMVKGLRYHPLLPSMHDVSRRVQLRVCGGKLQVVDGGNNAVSRFVSRLFMGSKVLAKDAPLALYDWVIDNAKEGARVRCTPAQIIDAIIAFEEDHTEATSAVTRADGAEPSQSDVR